MEIQLDLFLDYANNVKLYPKFLRETTRMQQVHFLETGHFALETHVEEVADATKQFLRGALQESA